MLSALLQPLLGPIVDKVLGVIPEPNKRAEAKEALERDLLGAVNQAALAQTRINEIEAGHRSIFVAGWRPFIGWVCGVGLGYQFLGAPLLTWILVAFGVDIKALPTLDTANLYNLVLAMLGMGGMRTFEKMRGVARETGVGRGQR